jgi:hypothetical protein
MKTWNQGRWWSVRLAAMIAGLIFSSISVAQAPAPFPPTPIVKENTTIKISEHVYVIPDSSYTPLVPNIGIIVGSKATLVVDTGLNILQRPPISFVVTQGLRKASRSLTRLRFGYAHSC